MRCVIVVAIAMVLILAGVAVLLRLYAGDKRNDLDAHGDAFWKLMFIEQSSGTKPELQAFQRHNVHPTRGWTPKPNFIAEGDCRETTNNRGHRSMENYIPKPEKYTVMVLGDSFTYGAWAEDTDVWPTILQGLDARLHVINLGVGGYGIDQMYITLRETIEEYKPQLVVFAAIPDDLYRCLLTFREYLKPRFVLGGDGQLVLTNTPIGAIKDTLAHLRAEYGTVTAMRKLRKEDRVLKQRKANGDFDREWETLDAKIIEAAFSCAKENGSDFLLVHLGSGPGITARKTGAYSPYYDEIYFDALVKKSGIPFLPTRKAFLDTGVDWTDGHYKEPEARFVAQLVYKRIQQVPSWMKYCKQ